MKMKRRILFCCAAVSLLVLNTANARIGRRWPSEKKIVPDPVTGVPLTFLTSTENGRQSKIYPTHRQWTADGKWVIFRGSRNTGSQVIAVNEDTGDIVQVTENGYIGMPCAAHKSNKLYIMSGRGGGGRGPAAVPADARGPDGRSRRPSGPRQIIEIDLAKVFADSANGTVKPADTYQRVCGTIPANLNTDGNMDLDANDDFIYFRVTGPETAELPEGQELKPGFGPHARQSTSGLRSMNLKTGEIGFICNVGFGMGHVQTNPWMPGEILFCWETGGKAPQRTWTVKSDGSGLRPVYAEAPYEWITHEAVIGKDEVAIAIIGRRDIATATPGSNWGIAGTMEHPTGVGIVNLRTREMRIAGQVPAWSSGRSDWHVHGSPDGRWAVCDDFDYQVWLMDRHNGEMILLAGSQKRGADHIHPTFSADSTRIEIQSALISEDNRSLNICVVPIPKSLLDRTYPLRLVP